MKYNYDEDGVAFYFFLLTVLAVYLLVMGYSWWTEQSTARPAIQCECDGCQRKKALKAKVPITKQSQPGKWKPISLAVALALFLLTLKAVWNAQISYVAYNPFEVLNISESATAKQIKKAFTLLSIRWHPDKNPDDKEAAAQKFMEIQRAYKALTDEVARKNWEEYGNPDGPKGFSLGIALPAWLVGSTGNKVLVLLVYALSFGVALPWIVAKTWTKSKMFTRDRIRHTTMGLFFKELKDNSPGKSIVELLACAGEFEENELLKRRTGKETIPLPSDYATPRLCKTPTSERVHALLYAHFNRLELSDPVDQEDKAAVVTTCLQLVLGMLQIAISRDWFMCARTLMALSQAVLGDAHPALQLPWIDRDVLKHFGSGKKNVKSIADLVEMKDVERRSLLRKLSDPQYETVMKLAEAMPIVSIESVEFKVLGQEHVHPDNIVTCLIRLRQRSTLEYVNSKDEGEAEKTPAHGEEEAETFEFDEDGNLISHEDAASKKRLRALDPLSNPNPPVHAAYFPLDKRPSWWVCLCSADLGAAICPPFRLHDLVDKKTVTLQFAAPKQAGHVRLAVLVKSDSLIGADVERKCAFQIVPEKEPHKEEAWELTDDSESNIDNPFTQD